MMRMTDPTGQLQDRQVQDEQNKASPWPVRLIVYAVLIAIALLAIEVIDYHVTHQTAQHQSTQTAP